MKKKKANPHQADAVVMSPCPFCGGKAKPFKDGANWYKGVECKCGLNIYFFYSSGKHKGINVGFDETGLNAVVEAWNKRV